jgi:hypothetical protein
MISTYILITLFKNLGFYIVTYRKFAVYEIEFVYALK